MPYADIKQQRFYQKLWMRERRLAYFKHKKCAICHGFDRLQLHHLDSFEEHTHRLWSWTKQKRIQELSKFEVLCANCRKQIRACNG